MNKVTIIGAKKNKLASSLKEIWGNGELLYFLVMRNLTVKYRQTIIGIVWVVLQPLLASLIFAIIFGNFFKFPAGKFPYILIVFCAFLPWNLFANSASMSGEGLIINRNLITKVYFPRILLPLAIILENLVDFFVSMVILLAMIILLHNHISMKLFFLPFFLILLLLLSSGLNFWLAALNVKYRDVRYVIPFLLQIWFYCSPVAYTAGLIPDRWSFIYFLNPISGIIEGFRWCFLGAGYHLDPISVYLSIIISTLIFIFGSVYFLKVERYFADII